MTSLTANHAYSMLLGELIESHRYQPKPRGEPTLEILCHTSQLWMACSQVTNIHRKINRQFMFAEAHWILSGMNRSNTLEKYIKDYRRYAEPGSDRIQWAYGPKVVEQLQYAYESLKEDAQSRQSVICLWRENPRFTPPCTVCFQFLLREEKIHCVATMRSSDAWLGWPYDVFSFSMITAYIGLMLKPIYPKLMLGNLYLTAGSQHIYLQHVKQAEKLVAAGFEGYGDNKPISLYDFNNPDDLMHHLETMRDA